MSHPSIAHIIDAGTTDAGRPYFAMEYVPGIPLTQYCDRHRLGIDRAARSCSCRSAMPSSTLIRKA